MATNGWGKGVDNNTINWGKGKNNATNDWGAIYGSSASGDTALEVSTPSYSNTKSIEFDGADDHITMGNVLDFSKTDSFSFSCWIKRDALGSEQVILGKIDNASPYKGYELCLLSSNTYRVMFRNSNPAYQRFIRNSSSTIADTNWHHIAFTYDGSGSVSGVNLYLDGSLDNGSTTGTLNSDMTNSFPFCISSRNQATAFFSGNIDEVGVFNSELSASDITAIYNSGTPTSLSSYSPLAWYRMGDGDTFPTLTDNGSSGNNGTMTNMVAGDIQTDVPT